MRWSSFWMGVVLLASACKDSDFDGVRDAKDCAPDDRAVSPDAKEVCDGIDNDCDGQVDEDVALVAYLDRDGDGAGDPDFFRRVCAMPDNGVAAAGDCDDFDPTAFEGATEVCDEVDNDCDGEVDEGVTSTWFGDADGDGHGVPDDPVQACEAGPGVSRLDDDCDDAEPGTFPGAPEVCNGRDDDCDRDVDEDLATIRLWEDADGDGYGDPGAPTVGCGPGPGVSDNALDCDDGDAGTSPDTIEARGNGVDEDCDGYVDEYGVGPGNEFATLADALASAPDGAVVQLDAGRFVGQVDLLGRDVTLAGEGCDRTTVYADGEGSTVLMDGGTLAGLTVSGGTGTNYESSGAVGGGVLVAGDATLREVCVTGNAAYRGGGVAVVAGTLVLEDSLVADNDADWSAGGVWGILPATGVEIRRSRIVGNRSGEYGGGLASEGVRFDVTNTVLAGNSAAVKGGAVLLDEERDAGGLLTEAIATFDHVTFHANTTTPAVGVTPVGEVIVAVGSQAAITNSLITGHPGPGTMVEGQTDEGTPGNVTVSNTGFRGNVGADKDLQTFFLDRLAGEPRYVWADPASDPVDWDLRLRDDSELLDLALGGDDPDGSLGDLGAYGGPDAPAGWDFGLVVDDDGDGMSSARELGAGTERWLDDAGDDPDQDGLTNAEELAGRTDPFAVDTDDDGVEDGVELGVGSDPVVARDHAPAPDAGPLVRLGVTGVAVTFDAGPSGDPDGDALTFGWSLASAPPTSLATLAGASARVDFTPDVSGTYVVRLAVGDGGTTRTTDVELRVRDGFVVPDQVPTLAEALDLVVDGEVIGLRPGTYPGAWDLGGRDLALVGLGDAASDVVLEGWGRGAVLATTGGGLALGRLTVQGGRDGNGGGIRVADGVALGLHDVVVRDNHATTGGGVWVSSTPLELTDVTFARNEATLQGGHLAVLGGDDHLALTGRRVWFVDGSAPEGGALFYDGGSDPGDVDGDLDGVAFVGNRGARGVAWRKLGLGSDLRVTHASFLGNVGDSLLYSSEGREVLLSTTVEGNAVTTLADGPTNGTTQALGAVWIDLPVDPFGPAGRELEANPTWVEALPGLQSWVDDGDPADLLLVGPGSPVLDGGFLERVDRDGTRSDASVCAGPWAPAACALALADVDADGLPDTWEAAFGATDPAGDPDADGLDTAAELALGTRPDRDDTDLDGVSDASDTQPTVDADHRPVAVSATEVVTSLGEAAVLDASGSYDPDGGPVTYAWRVASAPDGSSAALVGAATATPSLVPDADGAYRLGLTVTDGSGAVSRELVVWIVVPQVRDVPSEYATVAEAYAAALPGDTIRLAPGEHEVFLDLVDKPITIVGAGADQSALVGTDGNPVAYTRGPDLTLRDLTVKGGTNQYGGGIRCDAAALTLERVTVTENVAYTGGGLYLFTCDTVIRDARLVANHASYNGGALYADSGTLLVESTLVESNTSDASAAGLLLLSVDATLSNDVFHANRSDGSGAALMVQFQTSKPYGGVVADHLTVVGNSGTLGAVHRVDALPLTLTNSILADNDPYALWDAEPSNLDLSTSYNLWFKNPNHSSPAFLSNGTGDLRAVDPVLAAVDYGEIGVPAVADEDLRLRERSPAIDAGTGPDDADGSAPDLGAGGGPSPFPGFDAYLVDTDGDGMADVWESEHGLDPSVADGLGDADGDGISARAEFPASFPDAADSDGDGVGDAAERAGGGDPLDPTDEAPTPDPGPDTLAFVGNPFTRTASATDPQSDPVTYAWTFLAVPGRSALDDGDLTGASSPTVGFVPDTAGMYVLGVTASDGAGTSPVERLEVRVVGTFEVPADYPDLASAVYAATDGATIRVAAGTWPCAVDLDGVDLTIEGAGSGSTTLDAGRFARVVRAARGESVTVRGATLANGVDGRGGAIYVEGGSADLDDVALIGNAAAEGGALFVTESGTIDGVGVVGVDNVGGFRAGFLQAYQTSVVSFAQSVFAQNRAPDDQGGGFRIYESLLDLVNVVLHDNLAEEGGALYAYGSSTTVTLDHVTATHNDGTVYGSVIRLSTGADVTVVDSILARNEGQAVVADTTTAGTYLQTWTLVDENTSGTTFYLSHSPDPVDGVDGNLVDAGYAVDFVSVTDDGDWTNDDWSLSPTSDAVDAGDPAGGLDPDGSAPDLGATGGPGGFVP